MGFLVAAAAAVVALASGANAQCVSVVTAATEAGLTSLLDAVVATAKENDSIQAVLNLALATEELPEDEKVTIFAPINEAFLELAKTAGPAPSVAEILANHIVPTNLKASQVLMAIEEAAPEPVSVVTLLQKDLLVSADEQFNVFINPEGTNIMSLVLATDVVTCIGTVHVVETVLVPTLMEVTDEPVAGPYGDALGAYGGVDAVKAAYGDEIIVTVVEEDEGPSVM